MTQLLKLTPRERDVLTRVEFDSELPARKIAESIRSSTPAVAYALRSLSERGIISRRALVDFYKLGYTNYAIFFCLESETGAQHDNLLRHLAAHPRVVWLGALSGEYHFGLAVLAHEIGEVQQLLFDASEKFGASFAHKAVVPRLECTFFPRSYLQAAPKQRRGITIRTGAAITRLDNDDHALLQALCNSAFTSLRDIAQKTGLTASKVERRVRTLEEAGVIAARIFSVNVDLLGMNSFRLLIQLNRISKKTKDALMAYCRSAPHAVLFMECIGEWDYEIDVEVQSPNEIAAITRKLFEVCGGDLRRVQTLSELEDLKFSLYPFAQAPQLP